jgi:predicted esterase
MRTATVLIAATLFSFCSRGKSPQGVNTSEQNQVLRDTSVLTPSAATLPKPESCAFPLVLDLLRGANGSYDCNYRKTSYRFYVQNPQKKNGKVLVLLPGWNYPVMDWKYKTGVVDSALSWGFQVLLCDMGKSVYMDSVYPEGREDYKGFATRTWLWDSILQPVSNFVGLGNMVLMGLSTGARGAVLMGMEHQNEVGAVLALSGDYFPNFDRKDNLMINSMGPYSRFKTRWENGSNDVRNLDGMPAFVYLAHGMRDPWVNPEHTLRLKKRFNEVQTTETLEVRVSLGVHDYTFWNETGLEGLALYKRFLSAN